MRMGQGQGTELEADLLRLGELVLLHLKRVTGVILMHDGISATVSGVERAIVQRRS